MVATVPRHSLRLTTVHILLAGHTNTNVSAIPWSKCEMPRSSVVLVCSYSAVGQNWMELNNEDPHGIHLS